MTGGPTRVARGWRRLQSLVTDGLDPELADEGGARSVPGPRAWRYEVAVLAVVGATNLVGYLWADDSQRLVAEPVVALGVVWLARRAGASWAELGLSPRFVRSGLRWGAAAAAAVAAGVVLLAALPPARQLLYDDAVLGRGLPAVLVAASVRVAVGTALPEELIFRGTGFGLLARRTSATRAMLVASALFAWWHVGVLLGTWRHVPAAGVLPGAAGEGAGVLGVLAATFAAGMAFLWLRRRSGSLVAPFLAHCATNGLMLLAAYVMTP